MEDQQNPSGSTYPKKNDPYDLHYRFHQILGHVTTLRVAVWQLKQNPELSKDDQSVVQVAETHIDQLLDEINILKTSCYKLIK